MIQIQNINEDTGGSPPGSDVWEWNSGTPTGAETIGTGCVADGPYSIACGQDSTASGANSIAIGKDNTTVSANSVMIGFNNTDVVGGGSTYVLGENNLVSIGNAFVLGASNDIPNGDGALVLGTLNSSDSAVNSQLIGNGNTVNSGADSASLLGTNNTATVDNAIIHGIDNSVTAEGGVAIGRGNVVAGARGTAIGIFHQVNGLRSLATGRNALTTNWGEHAHTGGGFNNAPDGSSQSMILNMLGESNTDGVFFDLDLAGTTVYLQVPDNSVWLLKACTVAKYFAPNGGIFGPTDCAVNESNFFIRKEAAGSVNPINLTTIYSDASVGLNFTIQAVTVTGDDLRLQVRVNTDDIFRYSSRIQITQLRVI